MQSDETETRRKRALAIARSRIISHAGSARSPCSKNSTRLRRFFTIPSIRFGSGNDSFPDWINGSDGISTISGTARFSLPRDFAERSRPAISSDKRNISSIALFKRASSQSIASILLDSAQASSREELYSTASPNVEKCVQARRSLSQSVGTRPLKTLLR